MSLPKELIDKVMYDSAEDKERKIHGKLYVCDVEQWLESKLCSKCKKKLLKKKKDTNVLESSYWDRAREIRKSVKKWPNWKKDDSLFVK